MTTNVPALTIGPTGPVIPDESDILAGRQADLQAAFGGDLSDDKRTPQGQVASSEAAIIGDVNAVVAQLVAGVDPATSSGRMQDGIGALYNIERFEAQSTVVTVTCFGKTDTPIPINAKIPDAAGNLWLCIEAGTIPSSGSIDLEFACQKTGPFACPPGFINGRPYQAIPGWDSGTNAAAGAVGNVVESRADFEYRRSQSVAINGVSQTGAILGAVLATGVLDGWALENPLGVVSGAGFTGSITDNVLTVTEMDADEPGKIKQGQMLLGAIQGTAITGNLSGTGGPGTYTVSIPQSFASGELSSAVGGVRLVANSFIAVAYGGNSATIASAILRKKNPGCNYNGNTTVEVPDTSTGYSAPLPTYDVTYLVPTPTPIKFVVSVQNSDSLPDDAIAQVRAAVIAAFTGADGKGKARIAGRIFASRYYAGIGALGDWALLYEILVGIDAPTQRSILMRADQIPTLAASDIAVTFS